MSEKWNINHPWHLDMKDVKMIDVGPNLHCLYQDKTFSHKHLLEMREGRPGISDLVTQLVKSYKQELLLIVSKPALEETAVPVSLGNLWTAFRFTQVCMFFSNFSMLCPCGNVYGCSDFLDHISPSDDRYFHQQIYSYCKKTFFTASAFSATAHTSPQYVYLLNICNLFTLTDAQLTLTILISRQKVMRQCCEQQILPKSAYLPEC